MPTRNGNATQSSEPSISSMATHPMEAVQQYPVSSMMLVFGVGMGLGMLACALACDAPPPETTAERWSRQLSEAVSDLGKSIVRSTVGASS